MQEPVWEVTFIILRVVLSGLNLMQGRKTLGIIAMTVLTSSTMNKARGGVVGWALRHESEGCGFWIR
jgi:hypothetical protein